MSEIEWKPDSLGSGYEQHVLDFGTDPDGEGAIEAVLVRRTARSGGIAQPGDMVRSGGIAQPGDMTQPGAAAQPGDTGQPNEDVRGAVLYVHGFSDYFFQKAEADFYAERGLRFYALDLRKCGRALRPGQTAHYVSDLASYDVELNQALEIITEENPGLPVITAGHSTGGLIIPLWLHRRRQTAGTTDPIVGAALNSPWLDLQGSWMQRGPLTQVIHVAAKARPFAVIKTTPGVYGKTLHVSGTGEWEFDTNLKPIDGFPVTVGWMHAIRRGHARVHRGIETGVPTLVQRSARTHFSPEYSPESDRCDLVLDTVQIGRWAHNLGAQVTDSVINGARHDVFLSLPEVRARAYSELDAWLGQVLGQQVSPAGEAASEG
jgi:alpha-beta hydrolase superfamily lysophospholipase